MFKTSDNANPNYLAKIVRLPKLRKHSNADRLQCVSIDGNNVITGLTAKEGDLYVFFPLECKINASYLSWSNAYEDKTLNHDNTVKGFFNNKGRVRALRLRGERSEGYIVPINSLLDWLSYHEFDPVIAAMDHSQINEGYFDTFGSVKICEKYVVARNVPTTKANRSKKVRSCRIVEDQFRLHVDTEQFKRYTDRILPIDLISVTYKLHGTSFVVGNVLCNRNLKWYEKVLKKLGVKIESTHYDTIYASRKVVKNAYDEGYKPNHYYGYDLWEDIANTLKDKLSPGITLYGEAVGFTKTGQYIQKPYDYGCSPNEFKTYIYRITYTNPVGEVFEFSTQQVKNYCRKNELNYVPELFYGKAYELSKYFSGNNSCKDTLLEELSNMYLEGDCWMCTIEVPAEGVVIRRETSDIEAYKLKSFRFLEFETKQLDNDNGGIDEDGM